MFERILGAEMGSMRLEETRGGECISFGGD